MTRPRTALEHGQYGFARREKCKCEPCMKAYRSYNKRLAYERATQQSRRVDAEPVRRHVQRLIDAGLTYHQIVSATDGAVTKEQVKNLIEGNVHWNDKKVEWIYTRTAEALLAVTYEAAANAAFTFVPAIGVHRRIEALRWMGYNIPTLAEHLPISYSGLHVFTRRQRITTASVAMIDELYEKLSSIPGPDDRERFIAYRRGFLPPAAWDDGDIDDPDFQPDLSMVKCVVETCSRSVEEASLCSRHLRVVKERKALNNGGTRYREAVTALGSIEVYDAERTRIELRELRDLGFTMRGAAARLGRPESYISKVWAEVGP